MIPIFTDGTNEHEIIALSYFDNELKSVSIVIDENISIQWDKSMILQKHTHDLTQCVKWKNRYEPVKEKINAKLTVYDAKISSLAEEIAFTYAKTGYVNNDLTNEYTRLKERFYELVDIQKMIQDI